MNRPKKIIAAGDVHIFLGKRFEEHKHVFERFYDIIDDEKPDLIVLTGDLIDSKLRLGPEQISLCYDFLFTLANKSPLIIIPGNHDLALASKERMDSLSPILKMLDGKTNFEINYWKTSDVYEYMDLHWAVWSCIDDQRNPFLENDKVYSYTIGLYHGVISGSKNEDGFSLPGGIDIEEFKRCNIVIASDIHKQQSFRNGEVNYTGSLLQVSVNEPSEGTCLVYEYNGIGYDLRVRNIKNDYSTINLKLGDDIPKDIASTQKLRLKFNADELTMTHAREVAKKLNSSADYKVEVIPIVKKKDKSLLDIKVDNSININIDEYMKEFVEKAKDRLDIIKFDEDWNKIKELDKIFSQGELRESEYGDYHCYKMVINNFLSFGPKDNNIDLDKEGLVGILGKNRVGKSSVIKALQFCLFNELPNNVQIEKAINKYNRSKPAFIELYFTKASKNYRVKRTIIPNKKGKAKVDLTFHLLNDDGTEVNLTKESRPYTDSELRRYVGINDTFEMLSVFSAQKRQIEFIDCKNAERLKQVNKFLDLQDFELKEKNVLEELKEKNAVFNSLSKQFDVKEDISKLDEKRKKIKVLLGIETTNEKEFLLDLHELEEDYAEINSIYNSNLKLAGKKVDDPFTVRTTIDSMNKEILSLESKHNENNDISIGLQAEIDSLVNDFINKVGVHPADYVKNTSELKVLQKELNVIEYEIGKLEKQLNIDICQSCGHKMTEKDLEDKMNEMGYYKTRENELKVEIASLEEDIESIDDMIYSLENKLDTVDNLIEKDNVKIESKINELKLKINLYEQSILEWEKVNESRTVIDMLKDKINEYNNQKNNINRSINETKNNINLYSHQLLEVEKKQKEYIDKYSILEDLEEEIRILKIYRKIVNKDGLPLYILRSKIDEINNKINMVINQVFDFDILFSIDEDKGELKIQFKYDGEDDGNDTGLASGSETFMINLCIKVALSQILRLPKIESIFIDEGYDSLDSETIGKLPDLFQMFAGYYRNVITISHLDTIKDMCSHQLHMVRVNKYTDIR